MKATEAEPKIMVDVDRNLFIEHYNIIFIFVHPAKMRMGLSRDAYVS